MALQRDEASHKHALRGPRRRKHAEIAKTLISPEFISRENYVGRAIGGPETVRRPDAINAADHAFVVVGKKSNWAALHANPHHCDTTLQKPETGLPSFESP